MGDDQRSAAFRQFGKRLLDGALGLSVQRRRRFIEYQDRRVF